MKKNMETIKPFASIVILIISLLTIVFFKMEVRRVGYVFWKTNKIENNIMDEVRMKSLEFAKLTRPDRIEKYAKTFWALNKPENKQIVQMNIDLQVTN